ncbi:hypothetical protein BGZ65_006349, partial [Modicella reniformis]
YPSSLVEAQVHTEFVAMIRQKIPYHRKYMIYSAIWVPITSLFTIVPLVPNIPRFSSLEPLERLFYFYFLRCDLAYNGAKHLDILIKNDMISFQPSDVLNLRLAHDPNFTVFFTESNQLSLRRRPRKKRQQLDPNAPVITESSGEVSPTLNGDKNISTSTNEEDTKATKHDATVARVLKVDSDPMSMADQVAHEGFLSDEELETISRTFEQASMMLREIRQARFQEADKFLKAKMKSTRTLDRNGSDYKQKQE